MVGRSRLPWRGSPVRRTRCPSGDHVVHPTRLLRRETCQMVTAIQQPGHCLWRAETPYRRSPLANRLALMTDGDWRDGGFRQRRPSVGTLAWGAGGGGGGGGHGG